MIFDLTVADSGLYHCEVENEEAGKKSKSSTGNIQIKPEAVTVGAWEKSSVVGNYEVCVCSFGCFSITFNLLKK